MAETNLTVLQQDLVPLLNQTDLGEVIRPLIREIFLLHTYIAGTSYVEDQRLFHALKLGDKLSLQREDNKFDENAILVLNGEGAKLGYVPERNNKVFARLMDAGKLLTAKVYRSEKSGSTFKIGIEIYLVDI